MPCHLDLDSRSGVRQLEGNLTPPVQVGAGGSDPELPADTQQRALGRTGLGAREGLMNSLSITNHVASPWVLNQPKASPGGAVSYLKLLKLPPSLYKPFKLIDLMLPLPLYN